ncbi:MAG: hypothetical protein IJN54_05715 [Lachnospiraceae bacterium]|nr:hypothetical protein [Lachnospiraceae bacterium]
MQMIMRNELIDEIRKELKKSKIIYIEAPCGWGKTVLLEQLHENFGKEQCTFVHNSEILKMELPTLNNDNAQREERKIYLVDNLGDWVISGNFSRLMDYIREADTESRFVLAGRIPLPAELLPYKLTSQITLYNKEKLKFTAKELDAISSLYYNANRKLVSKLYEICNGMLLFMAVATGIFGELRMINKRLLGKCYEECVQYFEVACFKSYPYEYQIMLLKLAFFHKINKELLVEVFEYNEKESYRILDTLTNSFGILRYLGEEYEIEDFMRMFLQKRQTAYLGTGEMSKLYRNAYEYFVKKEEWMEAIRYADLNGDIGAVVKCMHSYCTGNAIYHGYMELEPYMRQVPESYVVNDPILLHAYAMMEAIYGNKKKSEEYVCLLEQYISQISTDTEEYEQLKNVYGYLQLTLPYQKPEKLFIQLEQLNGAGKNVRYNINISGNTPSLLHGGRDFCLYMNQGEEVIAQIFGKLPSLLEENCGGFTDTMLGEIAYEKGKIGDAAKLLAKGAGQAEPGSETFFVANMFLAKIMYVKNQREQAESILRGVEKNLSKMESTFVEKNMDAFQIYGYLLQGELEQVKEWLEYRAVDEHDLFVTMNRYCYITKIYAYIATERMESALLLLHRMLDYSKGYYRKYDEWHLRIIEIVINYRMNYEEWSLQLKELLEETSFYGVVRVYADRGAMLYPVLKKYEELKKNSSEDSTIKQEYYKKVLEDTRKMALLYPAFMTQKKEYESLSTQEMEVLEMLCRGKKNADIAGELFLSENTVKYHLKKIYQKLQVGSRGEAIARARELEIV